MRISASSELMIAKDTDVQTHSTLQTDSGNRVRTEPEAAEYCCISLPHFRRMRRCGLGPRFVQLSTRRIGYRLRDLDEWLQERVVTT